MQIGKVLVLFAVMSLALLGCGQRPGQSYARMVVIPSTHELFDAQSGHYMSGWEIYCPESRQWKKTGVWNILNGEDGDLLAALMYYEGQRYGLEWHYYNDEVSALGANIMGEAFGLGIIWDRAMHVNRAALFAPMVDVRVLRESDDFLDVLNQWTARLTEPLLEYKRAFTQKAADERGVGAPSVPQDVP